MYTCDPELNNWAIMAREGNKDISRDSLAVMDLDTQFAIFRSLPDIDKIRIFSEKIDLLFSTENFSTNEKNHLDDLESFMDERFYDSAYVYQLDSFYAIWKQKCLDSFGWDSVKVGWYVETWLTQNEVKDLLAAKPGGQGGTGTQPDCECLYDWYCGGLSGNCDKGACNKKGGCGLIGTSNCRGRCKP